jgi:transcriptional regulator with XRE-family HTH domain
MKDITAHNFALLREKLQLTQQQLANYLSIKRELISYYENGEREIPLEILEKASDLFGVDLVDFFEENTDEARVNLSFAFRADDLKQEDLEAIAELKKIVKNVQRMNRLAVDE